MSGGNLRRERDRPLDVCTFVVSLLGRALTQAEADHPLPEARRPSRCLQDPLAQTGMSPARAVPTAGQRTVWTTATNNERAEHERAQKTRGRPGPRRGAGGSNQMGAAHDLTGEYGLARCSRLAISSAKT